jgi:hypothetical protein
LDRFEFQLAAHSAPPAGSTRECPECDGSASILMAQPARRLR